MRDTLWQGVLAEVELTVSHANYTTWFKPTSILEFSDDELVISVPNIFAKQQFESKFDAHVKSILAKKNVTPRRIIYKVSSSGVSRRAMTREILPDQPLSDSSTQAEKAASEIRLATPGNSLNPKYTFDSFVVGSSNDLAYTASRAITEEDNLGTKYNPLFIYGGVGLGKTHLIQAIGNEIERTRPNLKVLYVSAEMFVNEFLHYIRFKKAGFSDKYRSVDVLIVDDIQAITGKEKTQDEFFNTFNSLHQANKQIIISSDKPPRSIPTLTERMRSRLEWGMAIDVQMPDFETRCAILEIKASQSGVQLDQEVIEFYASRIKTNIRELEGALNHLLAYAEMRGVAPDVTLAEGLLIDVKRSRPQHLTPKMIIEKTARYFQLSVAEVCSPKRDKHIAFARQVAMYLLRSELHLSFPRIAQEVGRKDHTTAMHSVHKIEAASRLDMTVREQVSEVREMLYAV